jgi:hypothetical protein
MHEPGSAAGSRSILGPAVARIVEKRDCSYPHANTCRSNGLKPSKPTTILGNHQLSMHSVNKHRWKSFNTWWSNGQNWLPVMETDCCILHACMRCHWKSFNAWSRSGRNLSEPPTMPESVQHRDIDEETPPDVAYLQYKYDLVDTWLDLPWRNRSETEG